MHKGAVHRLASLSGRQPRAKLPDLRISENGTITQAALGAFRQQLTYKCGDLGASALSDVLPDTILQSLPPIAYNLLFDWYGEALMAQTKASLLTIIEALVVWPKNKLLYIHSLSSTT